MDNEDAVLRLLAPYCYYPVVYNFSPTLVTVDCLNLCFDLTQGAPDIVYPVADCKSCFNNSLRQHEKRLKMLLICEPVAESIEKAINCVLEFAKGDHQPVMVHVDVEFAFIGATEYDSEKRFDKCRQQSFVGYYGRLKAAYTQLQSYKLDFSFHGVMDIEYENL